jgi:hypothetical protein
MTIGRQAAAHRGRERAKINASRKSGPIDRNCDS